MNTETEITKVENIEVNKVKTNKRFRVTNSDKQHYATIEAQRENRNYIYSAELKYKNSPEDMIYVRYYREGFIRNRKIQPLQTNGNPRVYIWFHNNLYLFNKKTIDGVLSDKLEIIYAGKEWYSRPSVTENNKINIFYKYQFVAQLYSNVMFYFDMVSNIFYYSVISNEEENELLELMDNSVSRIVPGKKFVYKRPFEFFEETSEN